jgi:hypothetical protein
MNRNDPAFPVANIGSTLGLTKREWLAALIYAREPSADRGAAEVAILAADLFFDVLGQISKEG